MGKVVLHYLHTLKDLRNLRAENPIIRVLLQLDLLHLCKDLSETNSVVHGNMFLGRIPAQNSPDPPVSQSPLWEMFSLFVKHEEKGENGKGPGGLMLGITEAEQEGLHPPSVSSFPVFFWDDCRTWPPRE